MEKKTLFDNNITAVYEPSDFRKLNLKFVMCIERIWAFGNRKGT